MQTRLSALSPSQCLCIVYQEEEVDWAAQHDAQQYVAGGRTEAIHHFMYSKACTAGDALIARKLVTIRVPQK